MRDPVALHADGGVVEHHVLCGEATEEGTAVTRLPLDQPEIVVGPVLGAADQRVVMVGRTHPLADRADLSVEDLADHDVRRPYGLTAEQAEATCPGGRSGSSTPR